MSIVRRRRLAVLAVAVLALVALVVALTRGGSSAVRPFHFSDAGDSGLADRAAAGVAHALYVNAPGGATATAARVDRFRGAIDRAAKTGDIDPDALEGLVYLESGGDPDAMAGGDPAAAAGLTQILPETATSLLHMHVDLAASKRLTARIAHAGSPRTAARLEAERRRVDERFDPTAALAGTVRYLRFARGQVGRDDLALASYHMGVGNLQNVIKAFGAGTVSYPRLFFGSAPDEHAAAWRLLTGFGDESSLYLWKVLAAVRIMHLYRGDRAELARQQALQAGPSAARVLQPPGSADGDPAPAALPATPPAASGLRWSPAMPADARRLQPEAREVLEAMGARVRTLAATSAPLTVTSTVGTDPTGWSFTLSRHYADPAQGEALQFALDRFTVLDAIAWTRSRDSIRVTVGRDVPGL
jgi:soluble lytic murein transglycosylase-like protein